MDTAVSYVRVLRLLESSEEEITEPLLAPESLPHMPAAKMTTGMSQPIAPKEVKEEAKEPVEISSPLFLRSFSSF